MSELDRAIKQWRGSLNGMNTAQRDELESHLRDHVVALMEQGVDRERAFGEATAALGLPTQLGAEYRKIGNPMRRGALGLALWTLVVLCVYRIGFYVPMPGVDQALVQEWPQSPWSVEWHMYAHSLVALLHGPAVFILLWLAGIVVSYRYAALRRRKGCGCA